MLFQVLTGAGKDVAPQFMVWLLGCSTWGTITLSNLMKKVTPYKFKDWICYARGGIQ